MKEGRDAGFVLEGQVLQCYSPHLPRQGGSPGAGERGTTTRQPEAPHNTRQGDSFPGVKALPLLSSKPGHHKRQVSLPIPTPPSCPVDPGKRPDLLLGQSHYSNDSAFYLPGTVSSALLTVTRLHLTITLFLAPFYRLKNRGTEGLSNLSKVTELSNCFPHHKRAPARRHPA